MQLTSRHFHFQITAGKHRDGSRHQSSAVVGARRGVCVNQFADFVLAGQQSGKSAGRKSFERGVGWSKESFGPICNNEMDELRNKL